MPWLYVPSVDSLSALGWGASTSALDSLWGHGIELWVTSNGTHSARPCSWRGWKTRLWIARLFGTLSNPSAAQTGVDEWRCSLRASRASRLVPQVAERARAMHAGSGRTSLTAFATWDRSSCSWRMSGGSLASLMGLDSDRLLETWPPSGSMRNGECSVRQRSERRTAVSGCSFSRNEYPTPAATPYGSSQNEGQVPHNRPTRGTPGLEQWAKTWATPGANDFKGSARLGQRRGQLDEQVSHRFRRGQQTVSGRPSSAPTPSSPPRLNPNFVDWMMGWPPGWTASEPLETVSSRSKPRRRS
jgi:hypothetical protein